MLERSAAEAGRKEEENKGEDVGGRVESRGEQRRGMGRRGEEREMINDDCREDGQGG